MKSTFLLLFFLGFTMTSFSQQKQIDSLEQIISLVKNTKARETKMDSLIENDLQYMNIEVREYFINKAIHQSKKQNDEKRLANIYLEKSRWYSSQMMNDSSMHYVKEGLSLSEKNKDSSAMAISWLNLANIYGTNGNYTGALQYYTLSLDYYDRNGLFNNRETLLAQYNLAALYYEIDEMEKSGALYEYLYNHPLLIEDTNWRNEAGINLTMVLFYTKKYERALKFAKELEESETRPGFLAHIYGMISGANLGLSNYNEALFYNSKAINVFKKTGDDYYLFSNKLMTGDIYINLKQYNDAELIFEEALNKLMSNPNPSAQFLENVYGGFTRLYREKGDYKKALKYNDKLYAYRDSLKGIEKQNAISDIEIKYETEKAKREKEVAEKQVEIRTLESKKNQNLFYGSLLLVGLAILSSLFFFGRLKARKKAELVTLELRETQKRLAVEKQFRDSELKALKAQMNPHFIFNALNSIQEYIILNQKNLAGDYLGKFADLMRKYLHHSDAGFITIEEEIESLEMYLDLESLRFEETLSYTLQVDNTLNKGTKIPTMLVQPYVENALKHGLLHRLNDRKLSITFSQKEEKTITCIIEDNGVGRKKAADIKAQTAMLHKSFATKATENRLQLLNYGKDIKIGVEIEDLYNEDTTAKGTKVVLQIPALKN